MGLAVFAGLFVLAAIAAALVHTAVRLDRQVVETSAAIERVKLVHLAAEALRNDATATRARFDGAADTVHHLGRR